MVIFSFKIDLKNADPERVEKQIEKVFDIPGDECIKVEFFFLEDLILLSKLLGNWLK